MKLKQKLLSLLMIAVMALSAATVTVTLPPSQAYAAQTQQAETIDLYFKDTVTAEIPSSFKQQYQITIAGVNASQIQYTVEGDTVQVSKTGLVTPKPTIWYKQSESGGFITWTTGYIEGAETRYTYTIGQNVVIASWNNGQNTKRFTINTVSYDVYWLNQEYEKILDEVYDADATELANLKAFTKYAAQHFDYSAIYYDPTSLLIYGKGDCWANSYFIKELCDRVGIKAIIRNGNNDLGAGSGHRNVLAYIGDKYYIADAGYTGNAPRSYTVKQELEGMLIKDNTLRQYDAVGIANVVIPETYEGDWSVDVNTVQKIGLPDHSVFRYSCDGVKSITLPKTVTYISSVAFTGCYDLENIYISKDNANFCDVNGILYNKAKTQLLAVPGARTSVSIEPTTTEIGPSAFRECEKITSVNIPASVTTIGDYAFYACKNLKAVTLPKTVSVIGNYAFNNGVSKLTVLNKNAQFGTAVVSPNMTIIGYAGSTAEEYANDNGLTFKAIEAATLTPKGNGTITALTGQKLSAAKITYPKATYNGSEVEGTWKLSEPNKTYAAAGTYKTNAVFTPKDTDLYKTLTVSMTVQVTEKPKVNPQVSGNANLTITEEQKLSAGTVTYPAVTYNGKTLTGTWQLDEPNRVINDAGTYESTATFTPADSKTYNTVQVKVQITVKPYPKKNLTLCGKGSGTMTAEQPVSAADITYSCVKLGDKEISGTWTLDDPDYWIEDAGEYTVTATFTPNDTKHYNSITGAEVIITVAPVQAKALTISGGLTAKAGIGTVLKNASISWPDVMCDNSEVSGTWSLDDPEMTLAEAGTYTFTASFMPDDTKHYKPLTSVEGTVTAEKYKEGFIRDDNGTRYQLEDGSFVTDSMRKIKDQYYCFDEDGYMLKSTYYEYRNKTYFFDKNGRRIYGWTEIDNAMHYFAVRDGAMSKGWASIDDETYYFDPDTGAMYTGTQVIDGETYHFDEETGVLIEE